MRNVFVLLRDTRTCFNCSCSCSCSWPMSLVDNRILVISHPLVGSLDLACPSPSSPHPHQHHHHQNLHHHPTLLYWLLCSRLAQSSTCRAALSTAQCSQWRDFDKSSRIACGDCGGSRREKLTYSDGTAGDGCGKGRDGFERREGGAVYFWNIIFLDYLINSLSFFHKVFISVFS